GNAGGNPGGNAGGNGGPANNNNGNGNPPPTVWEGNGVNCATNPNAQACKNVQITGCNANNPKNCPGVGQICGLGNHTGNPHCMTPQPTNPPKPTPTTPPGQPTPTTPPPTKTPPPPPITTVKTSPKSCQNWIVFHSFRTGNLQLFRLDGVEDST